MNRYSFSQRIALACSILLLAPTIESRAATIGVLQLSDGRQLANMSLLDPAMGAARNALTADGHTVSAIAAINAASLSGVRVLWLPLLETEAFYGQAERDALRGFYNGGGRIVWIGDAGIYNVGDDSFLSAFGIAKLPGTFDTSEPTLTASTHPVNSGPYGICGSPIATNATFGLMSIGNANVPTTEIYHDVEGAGAFVALLENADTSGRVALVCDSSIFADALDENGGRHRTLLRNLVAWLADEAAYTPGGANSSAGPFAGACEACAAVNLTFSQVSASGLTGVASIADGQAQCGYNAAPFGALAEDFVGFGFNVTTTAVIPEDATLTVTLGYSESAIAAAGFADESRLGLFRYDSVAGHAVLITSARDVSANTITGVASGTGSFLLGAILPPGDCDENGVLDACEIESDSIAAGGTFYCAADCDTDCNENGVPDACDVRAVYDATSPLLSPMGAGAPKSHTFSDVPIAIENATLEFLARGDLSAATEFIDVRLNEALIGRIFESGGTDCPSVPESATLTVAMETFRTLTAGGSATVLMTPSSAVDANLCSPASSIQVRLTYASQDQAADCNANGVPDECESATDCNGNGDADLCDIAGGLAEDCNHNGIPDSCEIAAGTSDDCNGNELPDECEGPFEVSIVREPATGGSVQPSGTADYDVCELISLNATPAPGHCFGGWTVSAGAAVADPSATATSVSADEPKTVTANFNKVILVQPTAATACPGAESSFSVEVHAAYAAIATYQWRWNGQNIASADYAGQTTAELVVAAAGASHAGSYDCVVTVPCGSFTSSAATLTLGSETTLATDLPPAASGCNGGTVAITVAATGSSLAYQWQYAAASSFEDLGDAAGVSGTQSATMILSNLTAARAGRYRCEISGDCGPTLVSGETSLSVGEAPTVSTTSANTTICEGETFVASVSANGTNLTYEWYFNGGSVWVPVQAAAPGVSGAATPALTITNAQPSNSGSYRCIVTGACAPTAQSSPVALAVKEATEVLEQPADLSRCIGQSGSFSAGAVGSALGYQWQFDGGSGFVNVGGGGTGYSGMTSATLTVSGVGLAHAGQYRCVVTGDCGGAVLSEPAELHVGATTAITSAALPADTETCPGGRAVFVVEAAGDNLTYQWQANTGPAFVSLSNGTHVEGAQSSTLVLTGLTSANGGSYQCVVAGSCGAAQVSRAALLTITNEVCDCNANEVDDADDIIGGASDDCNENGIPDECEMAIGSPSPGGPFFCTSGCIADCNLNGTPDTCDIASGVSGDCDDNGVPDECDLGGGGGPIQDCNANKVPDGCDIASGLSADCNHNDVPDDCEPAYDVNAGPDVSLCVSQATLAVGPATASGSTAPYSYHWRVASGPAGATLQGAMNVQPIFHATQSGEYTLEVTVRDASTPPCMKIDSLTVSVYGMAVDAGENLSLGVGETSEPLAPTVSGGVGEISHEWRIETSSPSTAITQFGGGGATAPNPTFTPELPGRYTLRLTAVDSNDPEACEVSDAIVVDSVLLTISRPADFAMCVGGESAPLAVAITSPGVPPYVYEWTIEKDSPDLSQDQFGTGGASASSPTFSPNAIGQYALRVTVRDSSVPPAVVSETIDVSAGGMQVSLATELSNCAGAGGMELPRPEVSGGVEPVTYLWTIEPGAPSDEPTQFTDESAFDAAWRFTPSSPGSYTLRLTTTDSATPACVRDSLLVVRAAAISIDAGEDFVTQAFEPSQRLGALPVLAGGGPDATYRWRILTGPDTDSDQLSSTREPRPLFTPKDVGTYALEVTGSDGECSVSDVVVVDAITASQTLEANSEGRVFMSLRIDEPHTAAEIRAAQAAPGTTFMGELTEDGGSGDVAGLLDGTIIGRRVSVTSEAGDGAFVMVVALLYDAGEVASVGDARVRIHAWAADDGLWRPATGGKLEGGAYPPRPTAADVGRSGALAMPAVGPEVYLAWAVVDSAGAFTAGLSKDIEPWSPDPGAADETPSNTPPIGAAGGMCGTVSAPMMLLGLIGPLWLRRRTGGDLRRFD